MKKEAHNSCRLNKAREAGMTLVEILIVLVIIGLVGGWLASRTFGAGDKAKYFMTEAQTKQIGPSFMLATWWLLRYFRAGEHLHSLPFIWLLPALCDGIENIFMLNFIEGIYNRKLFPLYPVVVRIKWALASIGFALATMTLLLIVF